MVDLTTQHGLESGRSAGIQSLGREPTRVPVDGDLHLGINLGHDRAAALVSGGRLLVAIEQERLDRKKHSPGLCRVAGGFELELPWESIDYCLDTVGAQRNDLTSITANSPGRDLGPGLAEQGFPHTTVHSIPSHHLAHAYSAWWPSGLDDAVVLVVDATGSTDESRRTESYSLFRGGSEQLIPLHSETVEAHLASMTTLGGIYEEITRRIGFVTPMGDGLSHAEAGKTMGLAPYGGAVNQLRRWIHASTGSFSIAINAYDILLEVEALLKCHETSAGDLWMQPALVELAAKVQLELEEALLHIVREAKRETGYTNLCLAGGVALNSVANHRLVAELGIEGFFAFPAAGDSGIAAGCAFWANHQHGSTEALRSSLTTAALGRSATQEEIEGAVEIAKSDVYSERLSEPQMVARTADALSRGRIVARYQAGSEYGPRALGQRSILADPTFERMRDVLNARVKHREAYRPFAPVIPLEAAGDVFNIHAESPHMLLVAPVRPEFREALPAITHHDGTGRVQTVRREEHPFLHHVCTELESIRGGPPVILNTSFNLAGEPIVESPQDAMRTFLATDIDHLALNDLWISKRHVDAKEYADHTRDLPNAELPVGLAADTPSVEELMIELDSALFFETETSTWEDKELREISARIGRYKEKSRSFQSSGLTRPMQSVLDDRRILLLDPQNGSELVDHVKGSVARVDIRSVNQLLEQHDLGVYPDVPVEVHANATPSNQSTSITFSHYSDPNYCAPSALGHLCARLRAAGYCEPQVRERLEKFPQQLEPTDLPYLDRFGLGVDDLDQLLRLFQLRAEIGEDLARSLLGSEGYALLLDLGALARKEGLVYACVDLFPVGDLLVATDHRYQVRESDTWVEDPVMYLGLDSIGLVNAAPRTPVGTHLDLCTGSGVQALVAASYCEHVVGVDLNPRAIRFARFNADLNGVTHAEFKLGDLFAPLAGHRFDSITANPPFVPSPDTSFAFRDGGADGEAVLSRIVRNAADFLNPEGRLSIVTDLVDLDHYQEKLASWWCGEPLCGLVLTTADRDEALFSVPHAHAPFGQSYEEYREELFRWVSSYRRAGLGSVNFGYILLQQQPCTETVDMEHRIVRRVVSSPLDPIHDQARSLVELLSMHSRPRIQALRLEPAPDLRVQVERHLDGSPIGCTVSAGQNPWFTEYTLDPSLLTLLEEAASCPLSWADLRERSLEDQAWALVEKGLLVAITGSEEFSREREDSHTPQLQPILQSAAGSGAPKRKPMIDELSTNTTPTCVSNYLR